MAPSIDDALQLTRTRITVAVNKSDVFKGAAQRRGLQQIAASLSAALPLQPAAESLFDVRPIRPAHRERHPILEPDLKVAM
jgi:hypothetical protein